MPRKKTARKSTKETYELYFARIHDWEVSYSFGVNTDKEWHEEPLSETLSLELEGEFLDPKKIQGRHVRVTLYADRRVDEQMAEPEKRKRNPGSIGYIHARGQEGSIVVFLPFLAFPSIMAMLHAGKCQGVFLGGSQLRYSRAPIRHFQLLGEKELQEEMAVSAGVTD
jgi:hypothetical protein